MKPKLLLTTSVILSLATGVAMYFMAASAYQDWPFLRMVTFGLSGTMAMLSFGAAFLFLSGLKDFRSELRRAYRLLCIGIILFGIAQVQTPLMDYFELYFLITTGLIGVPYLLSVVMIFLGMRAFVKSLHITTKWTSIPLATMTAIGAALLSIFLPHVPQPEEMETMIRVIGAVVVWDAVFCAFAARLAWLIRREIGPMYKNAMTWLFSTLVATSAAALHFLLVQLIWFGSWYEVGGMVIVPFLVAGLLSLMAGYAMLALQVRLDTTDVAHSSKGTLLDVVMYAAGLVSVPREIDATLDSVREITASLTVNKSLTEAQEKTLCNVYRDIEEYLVTQDRLKITDPTTLRAKITQRFKLERDMQAKLWGASPSTPL